MSFFFKRGVPGRLSRDVNLISLPPFRVVIAALFHAPVWAHSPLNCISPKEASHDSHTIISHKVVPPPCDESTCLRSVWEFKSLSFSATNCTSSPKRRTHLWWIRALRKYGEADASKEKSYMEKRFWCRWSLQRKTIKLGEFKLMPFNYILLCKSWGLV